MTKTASFTLAPAPSPRLFNPNGAYQRVKAGERMRFDVAGQVPLEKFEVSVFGPSSASGSPLRTTIVGRADRRGAAVVTLDVQRDSDTGDYCSLLEPYMRAPSRAGELDPHIACFEIS